MKRFLFALLAAAAAATQAEARIRRVVIEAVSLPPPVDWLTPGRQPSRLQGARDFISWRLLPREAPFFRRWR